MNETVNNKGVCRTAAPYGVKEREKAKEEIEQDEKGRVWGEQKAVVHAFSLCHLGTE